MNRGDLFRVRRPRGEDPRSAPVYTRRDGLATQVEIGPEDGLKHDSSVHCDALVSLPKSALTDYVATLAPPRVQALDQALRVALALA